MATPPKKRSRTPSGKPTIQCPECGEWVLLESGVGVPPYRQFTCPQGHRFGLAQAGNGHGHVNEPMDTPTPPTPPKPAKPAKPGAPAPAKRKAQTRNGDNR